jgi:hypothetical protein
VEPVPARRIFPDKRWALAQPMHGAISK